MPPFIMSPGTITITEEWVPEPSLIAADIDQVANALNEMHSPLQLCEAAFIQHVSDKFDSEGPGWAPWQGEYAERTTSGSILQQGGEMRAGLESADSYEITEHELIFTGAAAPWRWKAHQGGYDTKGVHVPARPMIEMTGELADQMYEIFDAWLGAIIGGFVGGGGTVQMRMAGGRFGPKVGKIGG